MDVAALAIALRAAFELPEQRVETYRRDAARRLERFRGAVVERTVAAEVLPALLR